MRDAFALTWSFASLASSCCAGYDEFHVPQVGPYHAPSHPSHIVHFSSGDPPCEHVKLQTASAHLGPVHPASQAHAMLLDPIWQSPWFEQPVRFVQKAIPQFGPLHPSAHLH